MRTENNSTSLKITQNDRNEGMFKVTGQRTNRPVGCVVSDSNRPDRKLSYRRETALQGVCQQLLLKIFI